MNASHLTIQNSQPVDLPDIEPLNERLPSWNMKLRHYSISTISEPTISEFDHHGDNAEICERETAIIHLGDDLESHRPSNPATATQECIEITTTASQSQDSKSGDKQCHSDISFLNVDDFPLSLEYSSLCSNNNEHIHTINDPEDFECDRQEDSSNVTTWNPQQLPLYEGSALTCASSSILMLKYAMKHNITKDALADLLNLIKLHCPKPNTFPPRATERKSCNSYGERLQNKLPGRVGHVNRLLPLHNKIAYEHT